MWTVQILDQIFGGVVGGGWVYYQSKGVEGHSSSAF